MKTIHQALNEAIDRAEQNGFFSKASAKAKENNWILWFYGCDGEIPTAETIRGLAFSNGIEICKDVKAKPNSESFSVSSGHLQAYATFDKTEGWKMKLVYGYIGSEIVSL